MRLPAVLLDVFATTLFLFVLYTVMALGSFSEAPERTLPPLDLAQGRENTRSAGVTEVTPLTISVKVVSAGQIAYYVDDQEVPAAELAAWLRRLAPREVVLRIDARVRFGDTVGLMALLTEHGVQNVTLAYRVRSHTTQGE
jgi:biopolymer transport protein ExbD